jgi:hypothetical protein
MTVQQLTIALTQLLVHLVHPGLYHVCWQEALAGVLLVLA